MVSNGEGLGGRTQRFPLWSLFLCSLSIAAGSAASVTWRRTCGWTWPTEPSSVVGATLMAVVATTTPSSTTEKPATRWLWNWEQLLLTGLVSRGILPGLGMPGTTQADADLFQVSGWCWPSCDLENAVSSHCELSHSDLLLVWGKERADKTSPSSAPPL